MATKTKTKSNYTIEIQAWTKNTERKLSPFFVERMILYFEQNHYPEYEQWLKKSIKEKSLYYVVVKNSFDKTLGILLFKTKPANSIKLCTLYVDVGHRHLGIGSYLLRQGAKKIKYNFPLTKKIYLTFRDESLIRFYSGLGFKDEGLSEKGDYVYTIE